MDPDIAVDPTPTPVDPAPITPGYKTTELYLTVVSLAGAVGILFHFNLDPRQIESLGVIVVILAPAAAVVWKYISERGKTKRAAIQASATVAEAKLNASALRPE